MRVLGGGKLSSGDQVQQKGTLLYQYPSARLDLQIRIRHWNVPQNCQFSVHFIITHRPCVGSATSDTDHINYAADCTDLTTSSNLYEVAFYSLQLQLTTQKSSNQCHRPHSFYLHALYIGILNS